MDLNKTNACKEILANSYFFQSLNSAELDKLLAFTHTRTYKSQEFIFFKGDEGGQLYAILNGTVRINTLSDEGKEITLAIYEKGDFFGEMAMFENECRIATAVMHTSGEVLIIEHQKFMIFIEQSPKIAVKLIQSMCKRLKETTKLLEDTLFLILPVRLAKRLLMLADYHGIERDGFLLIDLKLSQSELGNLVYSSRESINKLLRDWKDTEIIEFKNGFITIKNIAALKEIAEGDSFPRFI
ncbi:MAG: Crp/Fnr family transcriptional regulator [Gammaproteobacteria bacterium]